MAKLMALIDGSIYSPSVCDHAGWAATRTGASVEILHVLGRREVSSTPANLSGNLDANDRDNLLAELACLDEQRAKLVQRRGRLLLEEAKARLQEGGLSQVTTRLRHGDLLEAVLEFESQAELIVIGKRGEAADFAKLHLGSNLERVVRATQRPVLVAAREFRAIRRFMIAFDGGISSQKAVEFVARSRLFAALECRLMIVGQDDPETRNRLEGAAVLLRGAGYDVATSIENGKAETVIAARVESDAIDLLVMGAYGRSRIRHLIIGSTTTEMIRSCKIPIMLFR